MKNFQEMHLTVYRRGVTNAHPEGEGMVAWYAHGPLVGDTDERKYASEVGLQSLSFFMTLDEFEGLMDGRLTGCNDIGHNVRACGDAFTFFDMEFPHDARGVLRVPYVTLSVPYYVRRLLKRVVRMTLRRCAPDGDRLTVKLSPDNRERWARQYGPGTGEVAIDVVDRTEDGLCRAFWEACGTLGGETWERSVDQLRRIAQNGTARHTDVGTVRISKDWDGFYFQILDPSGRRTMNGGLINHGRDGAAPSWSLHT